MRHVLNASLIASFLLLSACGTKAEFASAQDVNGEQPDLAAFAVFGEADVDLGDDGIIDHQLFIIASDNEDICGVITDLTLNTFIADLFGGGIAGENVLIAMIEIDRAGNVVEDVFTGNDVDLIVDGGFVIAAGGAASVDTTLSSQFTDDNTLTIDKANGKVLKGSYNGNMEFDFITGTDINVGLTGDFKAEPCDAISQGLASQ